MTSEFIYIVKFNRQLNWRRYRIEIILTTLFSRSNEGTTNSTSLTPFLDVYLEKLVNINILLKNGEATGIQSFGK